MFSCFDSTVSANVNQVFEGKAFSYFKLGVCVKKSID